MLIDDIVTSATSLCSFSTIFIEIIIFITNVHLFVPNIGSFEISLYMLLMSAQPGRNVRIEPSSFRVVTMYFITQYIRSGLISSSLSTLMASIVFCETLSRKEIAKKFNNDFSHLSPAIDCTYVHSINEVIVQLY